MPCQSERHNILILIIVGALLGIICFLNFKKSTEFVPKAVQAIIELESSTKNRLLVLGKLTIKYFSHPSELYEKCRENYIFMRFKNITNTRKQLNELELIRAKYGRLNPIYEKCETYFQEKFQKIILTIPWTTPVREWELRKLIYKVDDNTRFG